jgi:glutaredoxin
MPKRDWVDVVDSVLVGVDKKLDRFRRVPRKRLAVVPTPIAAPDPFSAAPAAAPAAVAEAPLGDPELPVQIYGRRSCMWSGRAVKVFQDLSIPAKFYDIDDPERQGLEARLIRETKQYQTPWIYLRGELAGGYNAVDELHRLGQLELRTMPPSEREAAGRSRIRIEVAPRPPEVAPAGERR